MHQEVRIKLDISISLPATTKQIDKLIHRKIKKIFPTNATEIHSLKFAEEAELYSSTTRYPRYTSIVKPPRP